MNRITSALQRLFLIPVISPREYQYSILQADRERLEARKTILQEQSSRLHAELLEIDECLHGIRLNEIALKVTGRVA